MLLTTVRAINEITGREKKPGPCGRAMIKAIRDANTTNPGHRSGVGVLRAALETTEFLQQSIGDHMETNTALLTAANDEAARSKKILQDLANDVSALHEIIAPKLAQQVQELRSSRMAVVAEVKEALSAMKDVRKFFMESDYETEMVRLERFVKVCREIKALKECGVFDAVCDSALKLAVGP